MIGQKKDSIPELVWYNRYCAGAQAGHQFGSLFRVNKLSEGSLLFSGKKTALLFIKSKVAATVDKAFPTLAVNNDMIELISLL